MNLSGALSIASGGLANIAFQLGVVSNNIANANTPDYAAEVGTQQSLTAGFEGMGVHTAATTRSIDIALRQAVFQQDSGIASLTLTTTRLQLIDSVHGTPGAGGDLAALLGKMSDAFSALLGDPAHGARQAAAVSAADTLARGINTLSEAYTAQRQAAQSDILGAVKDMNGALKRIGTLSDRIVAAQAGGQSTADLENQRDAVVHGLSRVLGIRTLSQSNGDLIVTTRSGTLLPTRGEDDPVRTSDATIGSGAFHPNGGIPGITVRGTDITARIEDGRLGGAIGLRDKTLPRFQAELDEFSFSLSTRFEAQGLTLFTDPNGAVPAGNGTPVQASYVGFAAIIQVNAAVTGNPASVRDGTHDIAGSATGASAFTPNPTGGPAGFSTLITRVLTFALGRETQEGVAQPGSATAGLGPAGDLTAPFSSPATLADHATALVAAQAAENGDVTERLSTEQAVQKNLSEKLSAIAGVDMDAEMARMIQLQTAYAANARIISTVRSLFTELMQAVR